ncbi:hypothetical protein M409DRAFT_57316 [Zasmidium cellare ATCC 36951]|uniref:Uncharacterized protein n=1 Tax=Zasmidium cellare ATCC 36951 TaxID=1080233 RepID=A0A6A6CAZ7_ZASCE|nr:uncharacterized protein M409DRAFT_57316 [Zasmidium cellare ATCC 36951]KAF2163408.1 hypothetical protein M409DRAFT_57316 [Zasmidium cellare ATCC 36951]
MPSIGDLDQDFEAISLITSWLADSYREGQYVNAVLFLYSITDDTFAYQSRRALGILKRLCGESCLRDVVLIPPKWDQSADEKQDVASDRAPWEVDIDRNDMLMAGVRIKRCPSSKESALAIISSCIETSRVVRFQIQREVVDQGCELATTTVGNQLRVDLVRRQDELRQERLALIAKGPPEGTATMGAEREETKAIDRRLEENTRLTRRIKKAVSSLHTQERGLEPRVLGSSQPRPPVSRLPPMLGNFQSLTLAKDTPSREQSLHRARDPLSEAVATGSLSFLQMILERDFATIAIGSWEWLTELEQLGYTKSEVAELLLEQRNDQLSIVFAPWILEDRSPRIKFHVTGCVHDGGCHSPAIPLEVNPCPADAARNLRRETASLCGLGGVIPSSQEKDWWKTLAKFPDSSTAVIHYQSLATDVSVLTRYLATAMRRVCTALNIVQDAKACCNRFTVLVQKPRSEVITMRTINFSDAVWFSHVLAEINRGLYAASLTRCQSTARAILDDLGMPVTNSGGPSVFDVLHDCALAVQFLSLGLVSYLQAHIGKLESFFLEAKLANIKLLGSTSYGSSKGSISAALRRFTCLDDMTSFPVLIFTRTSTTLADSSPQLDLLAKPEDLLDTWGPGEMIREPEDGETRFRALTVRGGIIHPSSGTTFHWRRLESHASAIDEESFAMN